MSEEVEVMAYAVSHPEAGYKVYRVLEKWMEAGEWECNALITVAQHQRIVERLEKDSARYRWLVSHATYGIDCRQRPELTLPLYAPDHRSGLDAAIDEAISKQEATQ